MSKTLFYRLLIAGNLLIVPAVTFADMTADNVTALPPLTSPLTGGCLERALTFKADGNWEGVADQVRMAMAQRDFLHLPEAEEFSYLELLAAYHTGSAQAETLVTRFLELFPQSLHTSEVKFLKANLLFFNRDYTAALRAYNDIDTSTLTRTQKADYNYRKAVAMLKTGYYDEARSLFNNLTGTDYDEGILFYDAYIDYVNGDYNSAYRKFNSVPDKSAEGLEAEYYITQIDYKQGNYQKAINEGEKLLKKDVPFELLPETTRVVALSHFKRGNVAKAGDMLKDYVAMTGDGAERSARYTLATIFYDGGELEEAKRIFLDLTDNRDNITQSSWLYLGQIAMEEGNDNEAAIAFDKASKMAFDPEVSETALYNLATAGASGVSIPFRSSSEALEKFVETYPNSEYVPTVSSYLATSYFNDKNYEKALESISKIKNPTVEVLQARQKILYELGMKQLASGETDMAIVSLKDASAGTNLNPEIAAQSYIWLGDAYYRKKDYKAAAEAYSAALATNKTGINTAITQYNLGYARMKLKEYKSALGNFQAALASKGLTAAQQKDAKLRIADCQYYTGNHKEALAGFRSLSGGTGQDAVYASLREAELIGREGNLTGKIEILQRLDAQGNTGLWTQEILSSLAGAYSENGNDAEAARINMRILESNPSETTTLQTLYALAENAENLYDKADYDAALAAYHKLENSGNPDFYLLALKGIMLSSASSEDIINYAEKILSTPGVSAELSEEARFNRAVAMVDLDKDGSLTRGLAELEELAANPSREAGALASLNLGEFYLDHGQYDKAEETLLRFIDSDNDNQYLLAKGYIFLSDAYKAKGDDYLARLYLETLRDNYPGNEPEIFEMINSRLR